MDETFLDSDRFSGLVEQINSDMAKLIINGMNSFNDIVKKYDIHELKYKIDEYDVNNMRTLIMQVSDILSDKSIYAYNNIKNDEDKIFFKKYVENTLIHIIEMYSEKCISREDNEFIIEYVKLLLRFALSNKSLIVKIYVKYSKLIHYLATLKSDSISLIKKKRLYEIDKIPNLNVNYLFTRCSTSVSIFAYLLGYRDTKTPTRITRNDLKEYIKNNSNKKMYVMRLSINAYIEDDVKREPSISHVVALVKNGDEYCIIQSYMFQLCPVFKTYTCEEILKFIDDIYYVFDTERENYSDRWTIEDDNIWQKYFYATEQKYIGYIPQESIQIIKPPKSTDKSINKPFGFIVFIPKIENSYDVLYSLVKEFDKDMIYNIRALIISVVKLFYNIDEEQQHKTNGVIDNIASIIAKDPEHKIVTILNNKIFLNNNVYDYLKIQFGQNIKQLADIPKWESFYSELAHKHGNKLFLIQTKAEAFDQIIHFLSIILDFYKLKQEISLLAINKKVTDFMFGGANKYKLKYLKYKKKYIDAKK